MTQLIDSYRNATAGFEQRLALVKNGQWSDDTPCAEWDVQALVSHVLDEQLWLPALLGGETIAEVGDRFAGDQLGDDAPAAWRRAVADAWAAVSAESALDRTVGLSYGEVPAEEYLRQVTADTVLHTWDLARAIEVDEALDPEAVSEVFAYLSPQVEAWRSAGAFGPAVQVADDADEQTRLLALIGRGP